MRIVTGKDQARVFRALVEIIKVLATCEGTEADYAIGDVYMIASVVGGKQMTKILRGGAKVRMNNVALTKWKKDEMVAYIKLLEEMVENDQLK